MMAAENDEIGMNNPVAPERSSADGRRELRVGPMTELKVLLKAMWMELGKELKRLAIVVPFTLVSLVIAKIAADGLSRFLKWLLHLQ